MLKVKEFLIDRIAGVPVFAAQTSEVIRSNGYIDRAINIDRQPG